MLSISLYWYLELRTFVTKLLNPDPPKTSIMDDSYKNLIFSNEYGKNKINHFSNLWKALNSGKRPNPGMLPTPTKSRSTMPMTFNNMTPEEARRRIKVGTKCLELQQLLQTQGLEFSFFNLIGSVFNNSFTNYILNTVLK